MKTGYYLGIEMGLHDINKGQKNIIIIQNEQRDIGYMDYHEYIGKAKDIFIFSPKSNQPQVISAHSTRTMLT